MVCVCSWMRAYLCWDLCRLWVSSCLDGSWPYVLIVSLWTLSSMTQPYWLPPTLGLCPCPTSSSAGVTEAHCHTCIVTWMLRIQTQVFMVVWCNRCFTDWAISPVSLLNRIPKEKLPLFTGPPYAMDTKQETQGRCCAVSCQFIGGLILLVSSTNQLVCFFSSSLSSLPSPFPSSSLSCPLLIFFLYHFEWQRTCSAYVRS